MLKMDSPKCRVWTSWLILCDPVNYSLGHKTLEECFFPPPVEGHGGEKTLYMEKHWENSKQASNVSATNQLSASLLIDTSSK